MGQQKYKYSAVLFLTVILGISCQKQTLPTPTSPIFYLGVLDFGPALVGSSNHSKLIVKNSNSYPLIGGTSTESSPSISITPITKGCVENFIPPNTDCYFLVTFEPKSTDAVSLKYSLGPDSISYKGSGTLPGSLAFSDPLTSLAVSTIAMPDMTAGNFFEQTLTFTNSGSTTLPYPAFALSEGVTVTGTTCDTQYMYAGNSCNITFHVQPTKSGDYPFSDTSTTYNLRANYNSGSGNAYVEFTGLVNPSVPYGVIVFSTPSFSATEGTTYPVVTDVITDRYGNQVVDGTSVYGSVLSGGLSGGNYANSSSLAQSTLLTSGGVVTFSIIVPTGSLAAGQGTITVQSGAAYGLLVFSVL
jgi:hypothetical protein